LSHAAERKEKDCLNCGTVVHGRFCHVCGQENVVPKESFTQLVLHFFYDITHFDSKFFDTLRFLVFRPGFLPAEFGKGRRARYLNPIRMYVFTSALFFLVFFAITGGDDVIQVTNNEPMTLHQRDSATQSLQKKLQKRPGNDQILAGIARLADTTKEVKPSQLLIYMDDFQAIGTWGHDYQSMKEYDSIQQSLPASKRDGWLKKLWNKRALTLNEKYQKDATASMKQMGDVLLHQIPYLLFLSLPFFALILKLLYVRRKQFYYAEHGIFTVYHYIFSFILLLFVFLLQALEDRSSWGIWKILTSITFIIWPVYLFLAMKRFYRQGIWKTFLKFLLLTILGLLVFILLATVIFLLSIFQL
jgi:hypothetical protein